VAKANDPPLAFGEIIDRIEQMREELLILQRSLEKIEDRQQMTWTRRRYDDTANRQLGHR